MVSYDVEWYHHLPPHVKEILGRLESSGHKAYVVGGAVRDLWLGTKPKDYDIVSDASPEQIEALFPKTLDVGRSFGIMIVVSPEGPVEIARFRTDGAYTDGRHPSEVTFTNPEEDARRRDFTMNALFYDAGTEKVIDYVGGVEDLRAQKICTVGQARERFGEDSLRMLRAIRFCAQLPSFTLDHSVVDAIHELKSRISQLSRERVSQEIFRLLQSPRPSLGLQGLVKADLWEEIFAKAPPAEDALLRFDSLAPLYSRIFSETPPPCLPLAALEAWVENFSAGDKLLLTRGDKTALPEIARCRAALTREKFADLAEKKSIVGGKGFPEAWAILACENPAPAEAFRALPAWRAEQEKAGKLKPAPLLKGADLLEMGIPGGPEIKRILELVYRAQLNETICDVESARALAQRELLRNP